MFSYMNIRSFLSYRNALLTIDTPCNLQLGYESHHPLPSQNKIELSVAAQYLPHTQFPVSVAICSFSQP